MKWSESTTLMFVEEYLKHDCLFNSKSPSYRIKQARDAALMKICEVINMPDFGVREAAAKIKSIRSTYSQEVKKMTEFSKSGAGTDEIYVPTLKWFKIYDSIMNAKKTVARKGECNLKDLKPVNIGEPIDESIIQDTDISDECTNDDVSTHTPTDTDLNKPSQSRKRTIRQLDNLVNKVRTVGEMIKKTDQNHINEFELFGKSIAAQLNAMPLMLALQAQADIQNYMATVRLNHLKYTCSTTHTSPPTPIKITTSPASLTTHFITPIAPIYSPSPSTTNAIIDSPSSPSQTALIHSPKHESTNHTSDVTDRDMLQFAVSAIYASDSD